jgi:thioredoxin
MSKKITSASEFESEISKGCLTVVDFYADWCGPCKKIAPFIEDLSKKNPNVNFLKVDVDTCDVAQQRGISAMPTFQFFLNGEMIDEMKGADPNALEQKVNEYKIRGDSSSQFGGKAFTLGNSSTENPPSNMRDARLNRFKEMESSKSSSIPNTSIPSANILATENCMDDDEAVAKAIAMSLADNNSKDVPVPPPLIEEKSQEVNDRESAEKEIDAAQSEWDEEMVNLI